VGKTVRRGPVLGNGAGHGGPTKRHHDEGRPASLQQGVSQCRCGPPPCITRGSPGFVLVRGGLDGLAAGRPGSDPLPRVSVRPVQAEPPARADPLNPPIAAARVNPSHPGFGGCGGMDTGRLASGQGPVVEFTARGRPALWHVSGTRPWIPEGIPAITGPVGVGDTGIEPVTPTVSRQTRPSGRECGRPARPPEFPISKAVHAAPYPVMSGRAAP
jgi:hypothetical protein